MKTCLKCKENFPLSFFNKDNRRPSGYRDWCRNCTRLQLAKWKVVQKQSDKPLKAVEAKLTREKFLAENPQLKFCYKGQHFVSHDSFAKLSRAPDGLQVTCKDCRRKYRQENKELLSKRFLAYRENNKDKILFRNKIYREENRNKIREKIRQHYANNKEYYKLNSRNRKAKLDGAKGFHTNEQWLAKLVYFGNRCYLCNKSLEGKTAHREHRKPLSRGGTNWIANIAPACRFCNYSKHDKTEKEYRKWLKLHTPKI